MFLVVCFVPSGRTGRTVAVATSLRWCSRRVENMSDGHPCIAISEGLEVMDVKPGSGENKTWYPVVRLEFCVIQVCILSDTMSMLANLSLSSILIDLHGVFCIHWSWQFVKTKRIHPAQVVDTFLPFVFGVSACFSRFLYKWNASFNPSDHRIILIPWTQKGWFFVSLCQLHGYSGTAKKASQVHLFKRCCKFRLKKMSIQFCHCLVNSKRNILFFLEFIPILPFLSMKKKNHLKRKPMRIHWSHSWRLRGLGPSTRNLVWTDFLAGETGVWLVAENRGFSFVDWKTEMLYNLYHGFDVAKNGFKIIGVGKCMVFKPFGWCWSWLDLQHFFAVHYTNLPKLMISWGGSA